MRELERLIAEAFHRTGAVEIWGRGTNRVVEACQRYGIGPPSFEEQGGALIVTFRAAIGPGVRDQVTPQVTPQVAPQVTPQVVAVLEAARTPRTRSELQEAVGLRDREHFRKAYVEPLIASGLLERTLTDKPRSSRQRYRTTAAGERLLKDQST